MPSRSLALVTAALPPLLKAILRGPWRAVRASCVSLPREAVLRWPCSGGRGTSPLAESNIPRSPGSWVDDRATSPLAAAKAPNRGRLQRYKDARRNVLSQYSKGFLQVALRVLQRVQVFGGQRSGGQTGKGFGLADRWLQRHVERSRAMFVGGRVHCDGQGSNEPYHLTHTWRYKHEYCIERRSTGASRLQETDVGFTLWGCISHQPPIGKTIGTSRGI